MLTRKKYCVAKIFEVFKLAKRNILAFFRSKDSFYLVALTLLLLLFNEIISATGCASLYSPVTQSFFVKVLLNTSV
mgnify:CR=1 FL=1